MLALLKRRVLPGLAVTTLAVAVCGIAVRGSASAAPVVADTLAPAPVLPVYLTTAGFVLPGPNPRPAGPVTFQVSTADPQGHYWTSFALRNGVTLAQVAVWFGQGESPDKTIAIPALHNLYSNVEFTGGVAVHPSSTVSLTVDLGPDTYYFTDVLIPPGGATGPGAAAVSASASPVSASMAAVRSFARAAAAGAVRGLAAGAGAATHAAGSATHAAGSATHAAGSAAPADATPAPYGFLVVASPAQPARLPAVSALLEAVQVNDRAVFIPVGVFRGAGSFLLRNDSAQPQEANFEKLLPGTTDADVQAYLESVQAGAPLPSPFVSEPGGELLLSPGRWVILTTAFEPGLYCALSFLTDENTAVKQAFEGVHIVLPMR